MKSFQKINRLPSVSLRKLHELMKSLGDVGWDPMLNLAGDPLRLIGVNAKNAGEKLHQIAMQMHQLTRDRSSFAG